MQYTIKQLIFLISLLLMQFSTLQAITADELMQIHKATTSEMNNINTPQAGSLIYNSTDRTTYFYTGVVWKKLRSTGSETKINVGNNITITGNGLNITPYIIGN